MTTKNIKTSIQTLAVLLVAAVVTAACSSDDDDITGGQPTPDIQHPTTNYTLTVTATKGSGASNSIGFAGSAFGSCGQVTIGGTVYWDGSAYQNDGEAFLATSPLTYQP